MSLLASAWPQLSGIPFIQNYKPRVYKASSANYDVVQDGRGIMYFANFRGVLEYDGVHWRLFPLPNGTAVRSLATDSLGTVYVGGVAEMGFLAPDSLGRLAYQSLLPQLDTTFHQLPEAVEVLGTNKGAWFRGMEEGQLYRWTGDSLLHYPVTQSGPGNSMFLIDGNLYVQNATNGLLRWEHEHFVPVAGAEALADYRLANLVKRRDGTMLGFDRKEGFLLIQISNTAIKVTPWKNELANALNQDLFSGLFSLRDHRILVSTVKSGVYILTKDGDILQHLTDEVGLQDNLVLNAYEDRQGTLWLALSKGISRVDISAPLTQWNESSGLSGIVFSAKHFNKRLYATTTLGVFGLIGNQFEQVKGLEMESWSLQLVNSGDRERLIAVTIRGLYEINGFESSPIPGARGFFKTFTSALYPGSLYCLSTVDGLEVMHHDGKKWAYEEESNLRIPGRFAAGVETVSGELWLQEMLNPLVFHRHVLDPEHLQILSSSLVRLPDSFPMPQGMYQWRGEIALATENGIWVFDKTTETFVPETNIGISGPESEIGVLRMAEDKEHRLWIERYRENKRWLELAIPSESGSYTRDSVALRELSDIEVWGEVYSGPYGNAWIGTPEGLFAFNTLAPRRQEAVFRPLIRKVLSGEDSVLFYGFPALHGETPELPYKNNSITFQYAAPYYKSESEVQYSYFLDGWDKTWSPWKSEYKKDYTLLPPGDYTFRVKARNLYAQESAESVYSFRISAPWYRTPWAMLAYLFVAAGMVYGTVKLNTRRLHVQNEHLEKIVYERTSEIWAQHKEIIRKTAELKRQKEAIADQHELLGDKNKELETTLSKLKKAQSKLVESEKMASLGQLTAGIAHEINNPINFVKGNVGPLKRDFEEIRALFTRLQELEHGEDVAEKLAELKAYCAEIDAPFLFEEMALLLQGIEEGAQRTKQIVDGLQIFSRSDTDSFKMADVHQGIESTLTLLANSIKDRFIIRRDFARLPQIECMPGKLNQVFMNIISNAIQAMDDAAGPAMANTKTTIGEIAIRTREVSHQGKPGVEIEIQDNGPGIPESIQSKIFDPFFTTKDVGKGTGLGLSITFGIIEKHGGTIDILSPPEGGALFRIVLPQQVTP
ncbi:MAG: ATP-binding protein [Bacteroidia bacterium]|nr:ATP-binding protein [Bacteroidia bacterium]